MTTENQTDAVALTEEQVAAKAAITEAVLNAAEAVSNAEASATKAKADHYTATQASKASAENLKKALAYLQSLPADHEARATAKETVAGWEAELARNKADIATHAAAQTAAKEAIKTAKAARTEAKKALDKFGKDAGKAAKPAKPVKEKVERVVQNGVKHPIAGSKCGDAWALFDEVSKTKQAPATVAEAMPLAEQRGLNPGNVRAEYGLWRKFHGVPVQPRAKTEKAPAAPAAPAAAPAAVETAEEQPVLNLNIQTDTDSAE